MKSPRPAPPSWATRHRPSPCVSSVAGVPAKTIQQLARHRSFAATMRYMHLSPSAKDEGISMLVRSRVEEGRSVAVGAPSAGEMLGETIGQKSRK
jgi:hypothetical protein